MSTGLEERLAAETPPVRNGRRRQSIVLADPVGHVLGAHDRGICRRLALDGHRVLLATNEGYPFGDEAEPFASVSAFCGATGGGSRIRKGINYARSLWRVLRLARQFEADVVILYYYLLPSIDRLFVERLCRSGIPTVVCAHDVLPLGAGKGRDKPYRRLYASASMVLTFSRYARDVLVGLKGLSSVPVRTLFLGVDEAEPAEEEEGAVARERLGLTGEGPIILCFGQIKRNKGLKYLLEGFARLTERVPRARLLVAGRPWRMDLDPFRRMAQDLRLDGNVIFRPELIPEDEVHHYLAAADVVVLPYTEIYQSAVLPTVCALGKPVVATRVGGIPEVLQDGQTAYLVPPRDPTALSDALADALRDPAEAARRGRMARQAMLERYNWTAFCKRLDGALSELVAPARTSRRQNEGDVA